MERAANINPELLAWARKAAGMSLEDAASKIGIQPSAASSAAEKLQALESGERFPTRNQLAKIASVYRRPVVTFYLAQPPAQASRGEDFRTLPFDVPPRESAKLDALLRDIRARQEMVRSILEDDDEAGQLEFVGSATIQTGVQGVVDSIAAKLDVRLDTLGRRNGTADDLFKDLRSRSEAVGIFVLLVGDLGSHHHTISERVFRGFAIADRVAPFVVINDQDAKAARAFTLLHELAHIWLGQTGVSGMVGEDQAKTPQAAIELFCNDVAGRFLLPDSAFASSPDFDPADLPRIMTAVARMAEAWRVSEPMVAHRMRRMNWISGPAYRELASNYAARWQSQKARAKDDAKESEGGPSYYTVKQFKLGAALVGLVQRSVRDNILSHTKAAKVLGVNPGVVEPLIKRYEFVRGATVPGLERD
ncbi:XRE family transcriptional regulator [Methylobacterium sp. J-026]|uniref:helix-turn-helix domain-containing protein n=1 Tax=Methylobacterium sp. J-026 TaxID=2836624 RepID=UPI001FBA9A85|nr:XRE family transcriptional regulator [Methylobacterium sp. J-026]MCJ2135107.1 XRE family transcriptional regulator [Methylobacterium sp. J-026]